MRLLPDVPTFLRPLLAAATLVVLTGAPLAAQTPAADPSQRLREVLPADVAERVLARIADARRRELPPQAVAALENRALKYASRGVEPSAVERAIGAHAERMVQARAAIESARTVRANGEEIDAGAEALRQGVDGALVSALAKSAPSGRSLAVPLHVMGTLVERGLAADEALARVQERLTARASDRDIERIVPPGRPGDVRVVPRPGGPETPVRPPTTSPIGRPTVPIPTPVPRRP
jgi:hypothetical protein